MTLDWKPLLDIIDTHERFVLTSHKNPDADALGSELAMAGFLEARGKSVRIINPSAIPANLEFLDPGQRIKKLGDTATAEEALDTDVHVVLDTSAWQQLLKMADVLKQSPAVKVVIDHHVSADDLGAAEFKDTQAEATGAMLYRMAESLGFPVTEEIAVALFCAIATDTGWFRFPSTTRDTMRIGGELIDAGAQPSVIYEMLYERFSPGRLRLAGVALDRVTLAAEGQLAYTWVEQADLKRTGARPVDTENLVNECLKIAGTRGAFIAIEQPNKQIKISFRSRPGVNVAVVAEAFGGGGHKQAAGATLPGPLEEARENVLAAMIAAVNR